MPNDGGTLFKEMQLRRQLKLLVDIKSLPAEERAVFDKWCEADLMMQAGGKAVWIRAGQGSLLGIPAIVGNQPYSMTAKACWDAEAFRLSTVAFNDLIKTEPKMQEVVLRILAGEVRVARQALSDLSLWSEAS
jgi:CRP-like cAMP-binding protein